jgi:hypothetical protein
MAHGTTAGGPGEATASSAGRPRGIFALRWQVALVLLLFAGSLATLLVTQFAFFRLPQREASAREQVRDASRRMAEEAAEALRQFPLVEGRKVPGKLHSELSSITRRLLSDAPGVEGGFYLGNGFDQFTGYAFPTRPGPEPPRPEGHKGRPKKGGPPPPEPPDRREPPPLEEPFIRVQAQQSLDLEPGTGARVDLRQVETSLVVVATEPVGERRPALLATWVMVRLAWCWPPTLAARSGTSASSATASRRNCAAPSTWPRWAACWPVWLTRCATLLRVSAPPCNCGSGCPTRPGRRPRWTPC